MRKIRAALVQEAVSVLTPLLPIENVVSENMERPQTSGDWVELNFKPGHAEVHTLGATGSDSLVGVLFVAVHSPLDDGIGFGLSAVDAFRKHFTAGKRIIFEGQEVHIRNCTANLGRVLNTWARSDIMVGWEAYLTRGEA